MSMRKIKISPQEHYHVYNRGVNKQAIFHDSRDYYRFLFLILYFQSPVVFQNIGRILDDFVRHRVLNIAEEIVKKRRVELVAFCIMPNHFHLIIKELEEGGITAYMQRVLNSYSKYYNKKYDKSGHIFQGPYHYVPIQDDRQMKYLSTYIHRNPREMGRWLRKEEDYRWSSYQDFVLNNRWGSLIVPDAILGGFKDQDEYKHFVKTSQAKALKEELSYLD